MDNGGTGATTIADIRTSLNIPTTSDIPVVTTDTVSGNGITATMAKYGDAVTVTFAGTLTAALASGATILTLPEGYRPLYAHFIMLSSNQNGNNNINVIRGYMHEDGRVYPQVALDSGKIVRGSITYVVKSG